VQNGNIIIIFSNSNMRCIQRSATRVDYRQIFWSNLVDSALRITSPKYQTALMITKSKLLKLTDWNRWTFNLVTCDHHRYQINFRTFAKDPASSSLCQLFEDATNCRYQLIEKTCKFSSRIKENIQEGDTGWRGYSYVGDFMMVTVLRCWWHF